MGGTPTIGTDYASRVRCHAPHLVDASSRLLRLKLLCTAAVVWGGVLVWRLLALQVYEPDFWRNSGNKQHYGEVKIASERGPIYDRNGQLLAVSVPAGSVYVRPRQVHDRTGTAARLAEVVQMPAAEIRPLLDRPQPFVWIKRQIPKVSAEKVAALGIEGAGYLLEARRFYPYSQAGSALIGKVGIDGNGLSGLEALYDRKLSGEQFRAKVIRDALGNIIQSDEAGDFRLPKGSALHLTIDAAMQIVLDEELEAGRLAAGARGALGVLVDAETGELLALGQAPAVNFNESRIDSRRALLNPVVETVFEPGSIMKPIVAAAAIENGAVTSHDIINCENGRYRFGRHTIKDVHPYSDLSFRDVVVRSSNIGMTKVGVRLGRERLYESLKRFGIGEPVGLNLPGETRGILRPLPSWAAVDVATHSFGQGVAVTALQMARAFAAIANDGRLPALRVLADGPAAEPVQVISAETAGVVRDMLYAVVEDAHGTGKGGAIAGVRIGGKTGTAQKARSHGRGYEPGAYMASFIGFADAVGIGVSRKVVLIVVIDEPRGGSIYGGAVAAPVFQKVMKRVLHLLAMRQELNPEPKRQREPAFPGDEMLPGLLPASYRNY